MSSYPLKGHSGASVWGNVWNKKVLVKALRDGSDRDVVLDALKTYLRTQSFEDRDIDILINVVEDSGSLNLNLAELKENKRSVILQDIFLGEFNDED